MTYQRARQDDGWSEQQVIVLWENGEHYQDHDIEEDDTVIELPRADLIVETCSEKMYHAGDGQNHQKDVCQVMRERDVAIGSEEGRLGE